MNFTAVTRGETVIQFNPSSTQLEKNMNIETSKLEGAALDWAVARCGFDDEIQPPCRVMVDSIAYGPNGRAPQYVYTKSTGERFTPSTDWAQGGPIIEREDINVTRHTIAETTGSRQEVYRKDGWTAFTTSSAYWMTPIRCYGPTPLIAAMRCYVSYKLGDTVVIPDELI